MKKIILLLVFALFLSCSDSDSCDQNEQNELIQQYQLRYDVAISNDDDRLAYYLLQEFKDRLEAIGCTYDSEMIDVY